MRYVSSLVTLWQKACELMIVSWGCELNTMYDIQRHTYDIYNVTHFWHCNIVTLNLKFLIFISETVPYKLALDYQCWNLWIQNFEHLIMQRVWARSMIFLRNSNSEWFMTLEYKFWSIHDSWFHLVSSFWMIHDSWIQISKIQVFNNSWLLISNFWNS